MYDSSLMRKWDNQNVLDYAIQEAVKEAVKGTEIKVRDEERRKAIEEKKAIARELKKEGLAAEFIAKTTKLSIEEIEKL